MNLINSQSRFIYSVDVIVVNTARTHVVRAGKDPVTPAAVCEQLEG